MRRLATLANSPNQRFASPDAGPEMISGVRASSMRIESTSSTIAKWWPRCTMSLRLPRHVVAQVVEAELVVRAVGDVGGVLLAALCRGLAGQDDAGRHPERAVDAAHQLGLVAGEVVVDRDDVHALAGDGVEVGGGGGDQGLALTGLHLGDVAEVQGRAAHELHVEVAQAEGALGRLADGGERLGQQVVERFAVGVALAQRDGLVAQLVVGELFEALLEVVDGLGVVLEAAQQATLSDAQDSLENVGHGCAPQVSGHATVPAVTGALQPSGGDLGKARRRVASRRSSATG